MPFSLIKSGPAQSSPTFANAWLHSNRNLSNDGQSGGFKVFSWTILHVTHFFKYFLTVCLPRVIQKFVRNKFRVALTPLWQHFSWNFKISKSVNNEWLCNKIGFFWSWFNVSKYTATLWKRCENVVVDVVTTWHGRKWELCRRQFPTLWQRRSPALSRGCHNVATTSPQH